MLQPWKQKTLCILIIHKLSNYQLIIAETWLNICSYNAPTYRSQALVSPVSFVILYVHIWGFRDYVGPPRPLSTTHICCIKNEDLRPKMIQPVVDIEGFYASFPPPLLLFFKRTLIKLESNAFLVLFFSMDCIKIIIFARLSCYN